MTQRSPSLEETTVSQNQATPTLPESRTEPHELECMIQRSLQSNEKLKFARLTVHQCHDGVCLEGLLESNEDNIDLCALVNSIAGVPAINHVVMRPVTPK